MFTGELREYQRPAVKKLLDRQRVLLAMVMGSGKTPTTLAACEDLLECGDVKSGIIISPASLKYQWDNAIKSFTDSSSLVIDGTPKEREKQYAQAATETTHYIIMNYEQVRNDWNQVRKIPRGFIVGDEITAIKSFKAARSKKVKRFKAPYIFGLTGTPIENRTEELFSIMQWVDPTVLGRWDMFDKAFIVRNMYGGVIGCRNIPTLREVMDPAWVRLSRDDIADQLPAIVNTSVPVRLDRASKTLYRVVCDDLVEALAEAIKIMGSFDLFSYYSGDDHPAVSRAKGKVMARVQALRHVTAAPELLLVSAQKYERGDQGSEYAAELAERGVLPQNPTTPKLVVLLERIDAAVEAGEKVVVFSQYVQMIKLISARVKHEHVLFHGGMSSREKEAARQKFLEDPDTVLFLSSDAGGYGVDLPQAAVLINYDTPWSAGAADQRNARIDRVSSTHETIYIEDIVVADTIEEWISEKVNLKRGIGEAILDGKGIDKQGRVSTSTESLMSFLDGHPI